MQKSSSNIKFENEDDKTNKKLSDVLKTLPKKVRN